MHCTGSTGDRVVEIVCRPIPPCPGHCMGGAAGILLRSSGVRPGAADRPRLPDPGIYDFSGFFMNFSVIRGLFACQNYAPRSRDRTGFIPGARAKVQFHIYLFL